MGNGEGKHDTLLLVSSDARSVVAAIFRRKMQKFDTLVSFPRKICMNANQYRELLLVKVQVNAYFLLREGMSALLQLRQGVEGYLQFSM